MPIIMDDLEELAVCTTSDVGATCKPRFFAQHPLLKLIVLSLLAKAVVRYLFCRYRHIFSVSRLYVKIAAFC